MRKISLSSSMGLMLMVFTFAACGGGDADEAAEAPMDEGAAMPEAPAEAPATAGAAEGGDAMVLAGQQVFRGQGLCFTCHGQDGQGTPLAPNLADDEWLWIEDPGTNLHEKLEEQIRAGVAQPMEYPAPMPPMGGAQLTDEQVDQVAAYVASLSS